MELVGIVERREFRIEGPETREEGKQAGLRIILEGFSLFWIAFYI